MEAERESSSRRKKVGGRQTKYSQAKMRFIVPWSCDDDDEDDAGGEETGVDDDKEEEADEEEEEGKGAVLALALAVAMGRKPR